MADPMRGYETKLYYENAHGEMTLFGCIRDISGPSITGADVDLSSGCSPDGFNQFVRGMVDPGDVTFSGVFDSADYSDIYDLYDEVHFSPEGWNWRIHFYDGSHIAFVGYLRDLNISSSYTGEVTFDAAVKVTGKPTNSPTS